MFFSPQIFEDSIPLSSGIYYCHWDAYYQCNCHSFISNISFFSGKFQYCLLYYEVLQFHYKIYIDLFLFIQSALFQLMSFQMLLLHYLLNAFLPELQLRHKLEHLNLSSMLLTLTLGCILGDFNTTFLFTSLS